MTHTYRKSLPSILTPVSGSKVWKTYETTVYIRHYEYKAEHSMGKISERDIWVFTASAAMIIFYTIKTVFSRPALDDKSCKIQ